MNVSKEENKPETTKEVLSGFFHIGFGTAINMIIGFFTTPIITRIVDPDEYGRFSIFTMYISIAIMVLCFGLDQTLVRYYYKKKSIEYRRWLISNCSIFPMLFSIALVIVFSSVVSLFDLPFKFADCIWLLSIGIVGHLLYRFATIVLRLENKNKTYSGVYVANKCIYIVLAFVLVLFTDWNRFYCLAVSTVVAFLSAAIYALFKSRDKWELTLSGKFEEIKRKELVIYGLPFIVSMGLTTLFQSIDKISLDHFCDYATVGIYTSAMTIVNVFAIIQTTFNTMWAPMMVKHYEQDPKDREFYTKANAFITVIMFAFGLTLVLCKDVFGLLLGAKFRAAAYIVPFLTLEPIMLTISETTVVGIVVKNKSYMNIVVSLVACVTNFIGNTVLIPLIGPRGAAISTGLSYLVFFVMRTIIGTKYYKVNYGLKKFALLTIALIEFATISAFAKFGIWTVVAYFSCIFVLFLLYRDSVKSLWKIVRKTLSKKTVCEQPGRENGRS